MNKKLFKYYKSAMQSIAEDQDIEKRHGDADDNLCDLLMDLGYGDIVRIYKSFDKWHA